MKTFEPMVHGITQGMLGKFMECRVKAHLASQGFYTEYMTEPLLFGLICHDLIDVEAKVNKLGVYPFEVKKHIDGLEHIWDMDNPEADAQLLEIKEKCFGMVEAVMPHYFEMWQDKKESFEWVETEQVFKIPFAYGSDPELAVPLTGRIDGVCRVGGKLWLFETKTKGRWNSIDLHKKVLNDLQCLMYSWVVREKYGEAPVGIIYNLIRRPQLRPRKTESVGDFSERCANDVEMRPEFYFEQLEVYTGADKLDSFLEFTLKPMIADFMHWHNNKDTATYQNPNSCIAIYGACPFIDVCNEVSAGSTAALSKFKQRDFLYPELED